MEDWFSACWQEREQARLLLAKLSLNHEGSLEQLLASACKIAAQTLHVERVGIWLCEEESSSLRCIYLRDETDPSQQFGQVLGLNDLGAYKESLSRHRVLKANDVENENFSRGIVANYFGPVKVRASLDAPVFRDGKVIGVVCHEHRHTPRNWTEFDAAFAMDVASIVGSAFASDQLRSAESRLHEREVALVNALRNDALSRISRAVAHDLNNFLTAITVQTSLIDKFATSPDAVKEGVKRIRDVTVSASKLTKKLLQFGQPDKGTPEFLPIDHAIKQITSALRTLAGDERTLEIELNAPNMQVKIDPVHLEQVLCNLVINAKEATTKDGLITLRSSVVNPVTVRIVVTDNGHGMDSPTQARIFDPYFSTKSVDHNRGLGLPTVRALVQNANGVIHVETSVDQGSSFVIDFPAKNTSNNTTVSA